MRLHIILIALVKIWNVAEFYCPKGFQIQAGVNQPF